MKKSYLVALSGFAIFVGLIISFVLFRDFVIHQQAQPLCRSNLATIGLALSNYNDAWGQFPGNTKGWSWIADLIPMIEGNAPTIPDMSKPWNDARNRRLLQYDKLTGLRTPVDHDVSRIYLCPLANPRTNQEGYGLTSYVGIGGLGIDAPSLPVDHPRAGFFGENRTTQVDQIKDGLSNTMALIETTHENGPWRAPGYATVRPLDPAHKPYLGKNHQFGGLHREGALTSFADGSVRWINETIDPSVFEAMSTIAGGETIPEKRPARFP